MKLHHLRPAPGSTKDRVRKGRGDGSGRGKTAGRGTKGSKARSQIRVGFEGGQMPLQRRVPKLRGFTNPNKVHWSVVNLDRLQAAFPKGGGIDPDGLVAAGLARKGTPVKVLGAEGAGRVLLKPASPGTGVIAGGPVRAVLEAAGVSDVLSKSLGSSNPINIVHATVAGLKQLRRPQEVADRRGLDLAEMSSVTVARQKAAAAVGAGAGKAKEQSA